MNRWVTFHPTVSKCYFKTVLLFDFTHSRSWATYSHIFTVINGELTHILDKFKPWKLFTSRQIAWFRIRKATFNSWTILERTRQRRKAIFWKILQWSMRELIWMLIFCRHIISNWISICPCNALKYDVIMDYVIICRNCDRLDVLVFKVPAAQRPNAKMRVDQLKYDIRHLQVGMDEISLHKQWIFIENLHWKKNTTCELYFRRICKKFDF